MTILTTIRNAARVLAVAGLAAGLTLGAKSEAQTRAGSDGRALDANQQVGSAGFNPADGRLDFSRRNDIITGNVGGARGFRDEVGYRGVGEFGDTLGSDELFDFRTDSLSSNPRFLNAATIGGVNQQNNFRVFRSFTNRAAQPVSPGLKGSPGGGGFGGFNTPAGATIFSTEVRTDAFRDIANQVAPGRSLQVFNRPTDVNNDRLPGVTSEAVNRQRSEEAIQANEALRPGDITDSLRRPGNVFDPLRQTGDAEEEKPLLPGQLPPSLVIGQQLQTLIDPNAVAGAGRSQQIIDSMFRRLDETDAEADDISAYDKLLRDIRDGAGDGGAVPFGTSLEAPTPQQLTEAERAYDGIMKELYGEDYKERRAEATPDGEDAPAGVVDRLNYDLPRLQSLASNKQTRIADLTREAEASLANGKYLTAESRYRQILLDVKDDPLPRVGLVHAQLGAGMFRSAGTNLRALFVQHPELIAARYEANLLPPESRLQWIQQELQSVISQGEGGKDAPLLLAYLGYQVDSRQVTRYGMALAQSKSPRDPLLLVIREIWLDGSDTSSSDGE